MVRFAGILTDDGCITVIVIDAEVGAQIPACAFTVYTVLTVGLTFINGFTEVNAGSVEELQV
jgi:hypothetical protein